MLASENSIPAKGLLGDNGQRDHTASWWAWTEHYHMAVFNPTQRQEIVAILYPKRITEVLYTWNFQFTKGNTRCSSMLLLIPRTQLLYCGNLPVWLQFLPQLSPECIAGVKYAFSRDAHLLKMGNGQAEICGRIYPARSVQEKLSYVSFYLF